MSQIYAYNFEDGTAGTNMTTANNAGFTNLVAPAGTWVWASTPLSGTGTLSGKVTANAQTAIANGVPGGWTATPTFFGRFYYQPISLPSANTSIFQLRNGSTFAGDIQLSSTGALRVRHSGSILVAASGNLCTAGTTCRVELGYSATAGTYQLRVFAGANINGTTADYDSGALAGTTAGNIDGFQIGYITSTTASAYWDDLVFDNAAFPAPAVASAQGRAKVWNGTQWSLAPSFVWTGSAWKSAVIKRWDGSTWHVMP